MFVHNPSFKPLKLCSTMLKCSLTKPDPTYYERRVWGQTISSSMSYNGFVLMRSINEIHIGVMKFIADHIYTKHPMIL